MKIDLSENELEMISASLETNFKIASLYHAEALQEVGGETLNNAYARLTELKAKIDAARTPALL